MESEKIFELVHLTPKLDPDIQKHSTPEFWQFWVYTFGRPKKDTNEVEYWEKCAFVLIGWLGANKHNKEMEKN